MSVMLVTAQLKFLLGLKNLKNHGFFDVLQKIFSRYREIQLSDATLGFSCILFLFAFKFLTKIKTKNQMLKQSLWFLSISKNAIVVLVTSCIAFYYREYRGEVPFVLSGAVPSGLPTVKIPRFTTTLNNETLGFIDMVWTLGSSIVVVPISAVLANVAIAKVFSKLVSV